MLYQLSHPVTLHTRSENKKNNDSLARDDLIKRWESSLHMAIFPSCICVKDNTIVAESTLDGYLS